jgi:hypothetical protein
VGPEQPGPTSGRRKQTAPRSERGARLGHAEQPLACKVPSCSRVFLADTVGSACPVMRCYSQRQAPPRGQQRQHSPRSCMHQSCLFIVRITAKYMSCQQNTAHSLIVAPDYCPHPLY